ncbi:MAG: DMT family transporter [Bacillota bacterium]
MIKDEKTASIALMVTAIIWGTGFIGTEYAIQAGAEASLIISMRFGIAGMLLGMINYRLIRHMDFATFKVGVIAGIILFFGFYLQTVGQSLSTVSNSSFLTSTCVVIVPFVVWAISKKPPRPKYFILGTTSLCGAGILTLNFSEGLHFQIGDIFVLIAAACFAIHISYLGIFGKGKNPIVMTFLQMMVAGIFAFLFMMVFDRKALDFEIVKKALPSTTYLALTSSCLCYYLQTIAQQYASPAKTGLILCTEGLFGCIFAIILGMDPLTWRIVLGGAVIMCSVVLAEMDMAIFHRKKTEE